MKHNYSGKSLKELKEEYGVGSSGFFYEQDWYEKEPFWNDKPEAGEYEINLETKQFLKLTYEEQKEKLQKR